MGYQRTRRYPEISPNITMEELSRKWSELIRELNTRDTTPIPPADIYGRNYDVEPVFVTAGTSITNPSPPSPGYWFRYSYDIPADAGLVLVAPVSVSTAAQVQIVNALPPAEFSEGRTISIVFDTLSPVSGYTLFNMAITPTSGTGDSIVDFPANIITVDTTIAGSISISTSVSSTFTDIGGTPIAASAGGPLRLESRTSAGVFQGMVIAANYGAGSANPLGSLIRSVASNTGSLTASVTATASFNPLNFTFRAFRNKWVRIA
jgi:hypothetical protein